MKIVVLPPHSRVACHTQFCCNYLRRLCLKALFYHNNYIQFNFVTFIIIYFQPSIDGIVDGSQLPITQTSQSQPLGEDVLALCTGKFYDNEFVSPTEENQYTDDFTQELSIDKFGNTQPDKTVNGVLNKDDNELGIDKETASLEEKSKENYTKPGEPDGNLLKSILDELHDPEFDKPRENKFFTGGTQKKDSEKLLESTQVKKKFVIDSDDDEAAETNVDTEQVKKKKFKKKRPEKRALQISGTCFCVLLMSHLHSLILRITHRSTGPHPMHRTQWILVCLL